MPGKRRLAAELSVSVNTVDAAYQMLAAEGYLEARERSGFYVQEYLALPERTESAAPPQPEAAPAPEQPVRYDLSTRGVDPGCFRSAHGRGCKRAAVLFAGAADPR